MRRRSPACGMKQGSSFLRRESNISDNLLEFMVSKDAEKTKKAVDSFAELFNAAVNEAVKGKARQTTPKEGGGFLRWRKRDTGYR